MILGLLFIGLVLFAILYFSAGVLFESARSHSKQSSKNDYLKVLEELRRNPKSKALQSEARYLGNNQVAFLFGSQGREPSNADFEAIESEIADAINGLEYREHGKRTKLGFRRKIGPLGCLVVILVCYVVLNVTIYSGATIQKWLKQPVLNPNGKQVDRETDAP